MGAATKHLTSELRHRYPEVAWRAMARMRDHLIHGYFGVDDEIAWGVAANTAPMLRDRLGATIAEEEAR